MCLVWSGEVTERLGHYVFLKTLNNKYRVFVERQTLTENTIYFRRWCLLYDITKSGPRIWRIYRCCVFPRKRRCCCHVCRRLCRDRQRYNVGKLPSLIHRKIIQNDITLRTRKTFLFEMARVLALFFKLIISQHYFSTLIRHPLKV